MKKQIFFEGKIQCEIIWDETRKVLTQTIFDSQGKQERVVIIEEVETYLEAKKFLLQ